MGRTNYGRKRVRMNLEPLEETRDKIVELVLRTGADSLTEVIRRAVDVYGKLTESKCRIMLVAEDGAEREVLLL